MTDDKLKDALATLADHAGSFVTHWMDDDDPEDHANAERAGEDVDAAEATLTGALEAARAKLAALKAAAEDTSVFQLGEHKGNVMMPRERYDALEDAIAAAEAAGITPKAEG